MGIDLKNDCLYDPDKNVIPFDSLQCVIDQGVGEGTCDNCNLNRKLLEERIRERSLLDIIPEEIG